MTVHAAGPSRQDEVNNAVWASTSVVGQFANGGSGMVLDVWSDPGERTALLSVAAEARGRPILDIGVGGGRTTSLLRLVSDDYVGIDYTPAMVAACRRNYPDADVRLGDVRDLAEFGADRFSLAVFSYNGLDAVDHGDRARALAEIRRVLAPGALLVYSTHNRAGPCFRATPLRQAGSPVAHTWSRTYRMLRASAAVVQEPRALPRRFVNWHRLSAAQSDAGEWAIGPVEAHDFALLVHYVTLRQAHGELDETGLTLERAFDAERGAPVGLDEDLSGIRYFHIVARKR